MSQALKSVLNDEKIGYRKISGQPYPYAIYSYLTAVPFRASGKMFLKTYYYRITIYSKDVLNIEEDAMLIEISTAMASEGLMVSEWMENILDETNTNPIYQYIMDVSGYGN